MKTVTATNARKALFSLIRDSVRAHEQYQVTSRAGDAVLISKEDFDSLLETLELLSTPGFRKSLRAAEKDIAARRTYSIDEVFGR